MKVNMLQSSVIDRRVNEEEAAATNRRTRRKKEKRKKERKALKVMPDGVHFSSQVVNLST